MENASKALLIAGAILLVLAVIGIAIAFVGRAEKPLDLAGNKLDANSIKMHNSKFLKYEGKVRGTEVKACITAVMASNSSDNGMPVSVLIDSVQKVHKNTTSFDPSDIKNSDIYIGTATINTDGIVYKINFIKQ